MNPLELQLRNLTKLLKEQKLKYAILGGIAVSLYGEPRFTADIDVNVLLDREKIKEFLKKAEKYNFYPPFPHIEKIADRTGVIPLSFRKGKIEGKCDVIIAENIIEYYSIKRAKTKRIGSVKTRVVSAEDLIIHKITSSRTRDIEDLKSILIRQKGKLDIKYIRDWLRKVDKVSKKPHLYKLFSKLLKQY